MRMRHRGLWFYLSIAAVDAWDRRRRRRRLERRIGRQVLAELGE